VARTIARLPDNIAQRKEDLVTLLVLLPKNYPRRTEVKQVLESIRAHELAQMKFQELLKLEAAQ
jgi:hypothetical protein